MKNIIFSFSFFMILIISYETRGDDYMHIPDSVSKADKDLIKKSRKKIMQENPKCVKSDYGGPKSHYGKNGQIVIEKGHFFIICDQVKSNSIPPLEKMPFNVFFTKEDIIGNKSLKILETVSEKQSKLICDNAIMNKYKDKSFLNIHRNKTVCLRENYYQIKSGYCTVVFNGENKRIVKQVFDYFGKYRATCYILPGGKLSAIEIIEI